MKQTFESGLNLRAKNPEDAAVMSQSELSRKRPWMMIPRKKPAEPVLVLSPFGPNFLFNKTKLHIL